MEGSAGNNIKDSDLFFILGASDDLTVNLRKTVVRMAMRFGGSMEYLMNMPISQLMVLVEDIIEADEEARRVRNQSRKG